jgi:hypothetical protein
MTRGLELFGVWCRAGALACLGLALSPGIASAGEHYALLVSGASGGEPYASRFAYWRTSIDGILRARFGYEPDRVIQLAEAEEGAVRAATAENVRTVLADLRRRVASDDLLLVLLLGHGTATDLDDARFNLVGPDLDAAEWSALVRPIAGRVVFVNAASGSYPFLPKLAAPGRIVVTANGAIGQQAESVFPEFFFGALLAGEADADKNGRLSVWEAFAYASRQAGQWFDEQQRIQTERALLDDTGAGVGRDAQGSGPDGQLARATYIDAERPRAPATDAERAALSRRAAVAEEMARLQARKGELPQAEYEAALEKLLLDLAVIDRALRQRP